MTSLTQRTISGFFWMISGSVVQAILKIVVLAVLARLVSPEEFGVMGIALIVLEISRLFIKLVGESALVQLKDISDQHIRTAFTVTLITTIILMTCVIMLSSLLAEIFEMQLLSPVLKAITIIFVFDAFGLISLSLLQRKLRFKSIASLDAFSYGFGFGLIGIIMGFQEYGVWSLVVAHISQAAVLMILVNFIQPFSKKIGINYAAFADLITFGVGMSIARFWNILANQGDNIVIGKLLGLEALGLYGRAYQIMVMPAKLIGTTMDKTLFPTLSRVQDKPEQLAMAYQASVNLISLIALPISITLVILAPSIVFVFLGEQWLEVILPLQILASILLFRMSFKISDSLVKASGAVYKRALSQFFYAVFVFIGAYMGHFWGISGVAAGVGIAIILNYIIMAHISLRITGINWPQYLSDHGSGLQLATVAGISSYLIMYICNYFSLSHFLSIVLVLTGTGFPSIFFLNYLTKNNKYPKVREMRLIVLKRFQRMKQ